MQGHIAAAIGSHRLPNDPQLFCKSRRSPLFLDRMTEPWRRCSSMRSTALDQSARGLKKMPQAEALLRQPLAGGEQRDATVVNARHPVSAMRYVPASRQRRSASILKKPFVELNLGQKRRSAGRPSAIGGARADENSRRVDVAEIPRLGRSGPFDHDVDPPLVVRQRFAVAAAAVGYRRIGAS